MAFSFNMPVNFPSLNFVISPPATLLVLLSIFANFKANEFTTAVCPPILNRMTGLLGATVFKSFFVGHLYSLFSGHTILS